MSFSQIIGHDRPVSILRRALRNNTLAHAYIFSGGPGVGKKMTAIALATELNCRDAGTGGSCGVCPSCRKMTSGGHPDVQVVGTDGEEIKIDRIRDLQASLSLRPFEGSKKILIIDGAEAMNDAAQNAFLKTLEEPPGDALIVLITSMPQRLLATIRSRCQEVRFLPLSRSRLAQALQERSNLQEGDAWFLAALAQGSMGRAAGMDPDQEHSVREEVWSFRSGLGGMTLAELLSKAEALAKNRDRFEQVIDVGIEQLRDALVLAETDDEKLLVNGRGKELHRQWAARYTRQRLLDDVELLAGSRKLLAGTRVNLQLIAEDLLMKLARQ